MVGLEPGIDTNPGNILYGVRYDVVMVYADPQVRLTSGKRLLINRKLLLYKIMVGLS